MDYQYDRVEKTKIIINVIQNKKDQIYDIWTDILYTYVDRLKESWNDKACEIFVDKLRDLNYTMNKIMNELDNLKEAWERYCSKDGELTPEIEDLVETLYKSNSMINIDYESESYGGYFS